MLLPYHFVQPRPGADFRSFFTRFQQATPDGGFVCFDLEDSLQGATPAATAAYKAAGRRTLLTLLTGPQAPDPTRTLVRLNSVGSADYAADLQWLAQIPAPHTVLVPKVEDVAAVRQALADLPVGVRELVATVETRAGLRAVPALAAERTDARFGTVALGHCDLNLSLGHFPFRHQDSPHYWQWVAHLDRYLAPAGKRLLNSPVLRLADGPLLADTLRRLRAYPSAAGQITLDLQQTRWCAAPPTEAADESLPLPVFEEAETLAPRSICPTARHLLAAAAAHPVAGSALSLAPGRRLIAPQEVAAARRVLACVVPMTYSAAVFVR